MTLARQHAPGLAIGRVGLDHGIPLIDGVLREHRAVVAAEPDDVLAGERAAAKRYAGVLGRPGEVVAACGERQRGECRRGAPARELEVLHGTHGLNAEVIVSAQPYGSAS